MSVPKAISFLLILAGSVQAQDASEAGQNLFATFCWQCHGHDATGDGPMAEVLATTTPDLTGLSQRNGGVFPTRAVAMKIDGRSPLLAHGGNMPLFGRAFESDGQVALRMESGQPMMVGQPLADVITYLRSIQVE